MDAKAFEASEDLLHGRMNQARTMGADNAHYSNPGPTDNLRGIEANTDESKGDPCGPVHGTADEHGSMVQCADHPEGFHFRTYPDSTVGN